MWVTTIVDVGSRLQMYDDFISPMNDGGDEVCSCLENGTNFVISYIA